MSPSQPEEPQMPAMPPRRYSTAQDWLEVAGIFSPDDELYQQYLTEIAVERKRQYEEANSEADAAESD